MQKQVVDSHAHPQRRGVKDLTRGEEVHGLITVGGRVLADAQRFAREVACADAAVVRPPGFSLAARVQQKRLLVQARVVQSALSAAFRHLCPVVQSVPVVDEAAAVHAPADLELLQ